jgi:uncharacterized membrane protein
MQTEVAKVVEGLPEEKRAEVVELVQRITKFHVGPLPDAETLERYARVIPEGGERLMQVVERNLQHQHSQEAALVSTHTKLAVRGKWMALGLTLCLSSGAFYLGIAGSNVMAVAIFASTVVAIATVFGLGRRAR